MWAILLIRRGVAVGIFLSLVLSLYLFSSNPNIAYAASIYQLNVDVASGEGAFTKDPDLPLYEPGAEVTLKAIPGTDHHFGYWFLGIGPTGPIFNYDKTMVITMDSHKIIQVYFFHDYSFDITVLGVGETTKDPNYQYYKPGTTVTITATPGPKHHFGGWIMGTDPISQQPIIVYDEVTNVVMNENKSIYANFLLNTYTITASKEGHGSIEPEGDILVMEGDLQLFDITADPGYGTHLDVDGDISFVRTNSYTYSFTDVDSDHTITATFIKYGDVNADGNITVADAIMVARHQAGLITLTSQQVLAGDIDGTEGISMSDVFMIAEYVVKLRSGFPVE